MDLQLDEIEIYFEDNHFEKYPVLINHDPETNRKELHVGLLTPANKNILSIGVLKQNKIHYLFYDKNQIVSFRILVPYPLEFPVEEKNFCFTWKNGPDIIPIKFLSGKNEKYGIDFNLDVMNFYNFMEPFDSNKEYAINHFINADKVAKIDLSYEN